MKNKNKFSALLSVITLAMILFNQAALAEETPAGQDQLRLHTGTPKRTGDPVFSYTVEWRVDGGLTYRGTGLLFVKGSDNRKPTTDIQIAKNMVSALNDGMVQQYPSWRGVLPENTPDQPELVLSNKDGFSFTHITFRDYTNQKITYDVLGKTFNVADIDMAIDMVFAADIDYIEGFTMAKPKKTDKHQGSIEISIDDDKPVIIKTNGKTTEQLEKEIASALGSAVLSTKPLYPSLKDRDNRNNKPFDGSEVHMTHLPAKSITIDINDPSLGVLTKFKYSDTNQTTEMFDDPVSIIALLGFLAIGFVGFTWYQGRKQRKATDQSAED